MTTKFLDNKICNFKFLLSLRFPRETVFLDNSPLYPLAPPPQKRKFYFYCRLAVSEKRSSTFGTPPHTPAMEDIVLLVKGLQCKSNCRAFRRPVQSMCLDLHGVASTEAQLVNHHVPFLGTP